MGYGDYPLEGAKVMKIRISLVQFARNDHGKSENIKRMTKILNEIKHTDIVCLPENWIGREVLDEDECNGLNSNLSEIASKQNFNLLTGGAYVRRADEIFSSCYVIGRNGKILGRCDKLFPSKSIGEREFLSAGKTVCNFKVDGSNVGIMICVDAVYPEICRILASKGAEIIFNPSNIPENRLEMWKHVGVTRAIENGVYFVFTNNTSSYYLDGRKITGHSFIASPEGEIIIEANEKEQVIDRELDLTRVGSIRSRWPFLRDILERKLP